MMLGGCSAAGLPLWLMRSHDSLGPETEVTATEDEKERRKPGKRGAWSSKGMRPCAWAPRVSGCWAWQGQEVRRTEGMEEGGCEERASGSQEAERNNLERKANVPENPRD